MGQTWLFLQNHFKRRFSQMGVRPLNDRVVVLRIEEEEKTSGGIIIPDTAKEKPQEGRVIAVGTGKVNDKGDRIPLEVKENDRILFGKYSGNEIKIDGVEHLIMREDDILAIIE
jgi:chaperonin GroES